MICTLLFYLRMYMFLKWVIYFYLDFIKSFITFHNFYLFICIVQIFFSSLLNFPLCSNVFLVDFFK